MTLVIGRSERVRKPIKIYSMLDFHSAFVLTSTNEEPKLVREMVDSTEGRLWEDAMVEEMGSFQNNEMWYLFELYSGINPIGSKWVFKKKMTVVGQVYKFKARLVEKGYSQVKGVEFRDIFSPIANLTSIRVLMSLATTFDLEIKQMDVKTTFLHRDLEE
jgi:hypothetical protein